MYLFQKGVVYLMNVLLAVVFAGRNGKIQFGVCKEGIHDIHFIQTSLPQCIENCVSRKECVSLNYQRSTKLCRLHRDDSTLYQSKSHGITYSEKIKWDIQSPDGCSTCPSYKTCIQDDSTDQSYCTYTECRIHQNLPDGQIIGNERHVGSNVQYTCQQGFTLYGTSIRSCLDNGNWSGIEPICCPDGWYSYETSCYKFEVGLKLTFDDAVAHCHQAHQGSRLLFIEFEGEDSFVKDTLEHIAGIETDPKWEFYWIGMTRIGDVWKVGETDTAVPWFNWLPAEPSFSYGGNTENCGSVFYSPRWLSWGWNDIVCEFQLHTICELNRN